jgi:hypothetical protein
MPGVEGATSIAVSDPFVNGSVIGFQSAPGQVGLRVHARYDKCRAAHLYLEMFDRGQARTECKTVLLHRSSAVNDNIPAAAGVVAPDQRNIIDIKEILKAMN